MEMRAHPWTSAIIRAAPHFQDTHNIPYLHFPAFHGQSSRNSMHVLISTPNRCLAASPPAPGRIKRRRTVFSRDPVQGYAAVEVLRFACIKEELAHGHMGEFGQFTRHTNGEQTHKFGKQVPGRSGEPDPGRLLRCGPAYRRPAFPQPRNTNPATKRLRCSRLSMQLPALRGSTHRIEASSGCDIRCCKSASHMGRPN